MAHGTRPIRLSIIALLVWAGPLARLSFAQATEVAVTAVALVSVQPTNKDFVGAPYLDKGLGGVGPGFGAGLSVVTPRGFVAIAEFSMASFEVEQSGRLVDGGQATGRLRDSLLSGLAGLAFSSSRRRLQLVGGASWLLDTPAEDDISILDSESGDNDFLSEGQSRLAFTGGADFLQRLSTRLSFVATGRYSKLWRSSRADELGIGSHIFRAGAGLRIQLTR